MSLKFKAMVLSCIDPRFQPIVFNFLKKKNLLGKYSSFTIAGGSIGVTKGKFNSWKKVFWDNLLISIKFHRIKKLIIINHLDCGMAKLVNLKKNFNENIETNIHSISFKKIKRNLKKKFPNLKVELFLISLDKKVRKY